VGSILHSELMGTVRTRPITSGRIIITVFDTVLSVMVDYQMIGSIGRMIYFNIMSSMYSRDCQVLHTGETLASLRTLVISTPPDYAGRVRLGPGWLCCGTAVCPIYYPREFGIFLNFNTSLV